MKGVAVMNKYFLYYLFTACVAGVFMIFSGINLFLFAGIVAVVGILAAATWSLGDCLADSLQNLMRKPMAPAARFLTKSAVVYATLCESCMLINMIKPQYASVCSVICLSGGALLALLALGIYSLRTIMIKFANR